MSDPSLAELPALFCFPCADRKGISAQAYNLLLNTYNFFSGTHFLEMGTNSLMDK